jgi:hypothetical protein
VSDLYEADILAWSERQRDLLRRVVAGEAVKETPDWPNIIEEIEGVGREQLHAVESLLAQAITHILKAQAWPHAREVPYWQAEARWFRGEATDRSTASRRQKIDPSPESTPMAATRSLLSLVLDAWPRLTTVTGSRRQVYRWLTVD